MEKKLQGKLLKFSIIIPNFLDKNIDEVVKVAKKVRNAEIIVVESGEQILDSSLKEGVKYKFSKTKLLPGAARNEGAILSKGPLLVFLDSDLILSESAINFLNNFHSKIDEKIIFGHYIPDSGPSVFSRFQNSILKYRFYDVFKKQKVRYGQSSHMLIKRLTFFKVGSFAPNLRMREDTEFCFRADNIGIKSEIEDSFTGTHLKNFELISIHKDYFYRTYQSLKVKFRNPKLFNMGSSLISFKLYLALISSLFIGILPLFSIPFGQAEYSTFILLLIALMGLISPLFIVPEIFRKQRFSTSLVGLTIFPSIFAAMIFGGLWALLETLFLKSKNFILGTLDWAILLKRVLWRNGYPVQIIQFATARCNLRCEHCFYKESLDAPNPGELDQSIFKQLSKETKPLLWYAFAGGEVFIRKDFPALYNTVSTIGRPKLITIPTNGWYTEKTYNAILQMLHENPTQSLIIQLSIDGTQEIHDAIRGQNSFNRAIETFNKLSPLRNLFPNFQLAFITVVTPQNKHIYPEFIDELLSFNPNQININLFRYGYLDHPQLPKSLVETYKVAVEYYESLIRKNKLRNFTFLGATAMRLKEIMQKELIYKVAMENKFVTPCTAGSLSYVVWENGNLGPCEILPDKNFNITQKDILEKRTSYKELFKSQHSRALRKRIKDTECKCTYECAMSNNTFFSWPMTRQFASRYFKDMFMKKEIH